jgi:hypothetical protein
VSKAERDRLFRKGLELDPVPAGAIERKLKSTIPAVEGIGIKVGVYAKKAEKK